MKKMMMTLIALLTMSAAANAMSYEQARNEALFLTDKMAYELDLTDEQYEAAYEINLDYLMGVTSPDDVYGLYWERRNLDMSYILYQWQWDAFCAASYFFRPLYWTAGRWHFGIYARYTVRDYFYFGRPHFYVSYRGGHAWHLNGGHSYYYGRRDHFRPALGNNRQHFGMRQRFDRNNGGYRNHQPMGRDNGRTHMGSNRGEDRNRMGSNRGDRPGSSTRVTAGQRDRSMDNGNRQFGGNRQNNTAAPRQNYNPGTTTTPSRPTTTTPTTPSRPSNSTATPTRSFGGSRSSSNSSATRSSSSPSRSSSSASRSSSSASRSSSGGHFGGRRH